MAEDLQSKAADLVKKIITVGVGAVFLTEESLRGLMSEFKLPKEMLGGILDNARRTRDDFLLKISEDLKTKVFEKVDPKELLNEVLARNDVHLDVKIRFSPKGDSKSINDTE